MPPKGKQKDTTAEDFKAVGVSKDAPACHNCAHYYERPSEPHGVCGVDLPPFVQRSNNKNHYKVNQNYLCRLWARKET